MKFETLLIYAIIKVISPNDLYSRNEAFVLNINKIRHRNGTHIKTENRYSQKMYEQPLMLDISAIADIADRKAHKLIQC